MGKRIRNKIKMRKSLLLSLLLSVTNSFSQDVYKTLVEGTLSGLPFELRQVTLSSEDACDQFSHSQILMYFKNENEPDKMDIGIFTFNQLNDWNQFWRDFNNAFTSKKNNFGAFPIVTGKTYAMFKSDAKPFHLSIISNADNKLALIDMRYDPTEEELEANYSKQIRMGWQNDKCEGGILID